jgi:putative transposase
MGRLERTSLPDGYYHVFSRGVCGIGPIFRDDDDCETFLDLLRRTARRNTWKCHAYCLMGTHYHIVLEARRDALSAGVGWLNWRYAIGFNRRYGRFGHLFADRFTSRVIGSEEYLYEACTYVLLNPVKAGLCDSVEQWPWSWCRYGLESA